MNNLLTFILNELVEKNPTRITKFLKLYIFKIFHQLNALYYTTITIYDDFQGINEKLKCKCKYYAPTQLKFFNPYTALSSVKVYANEGCSKNTIPVTRFLKLLHLLKNSFKENIT